MRRVITVFILFAALVPVVPTALAWDYSVHRLVNELALASLPTNFPAFVRTPESIERIAFLSGEADRWRNTSDLALKHVNGPDHYIDIEDLQIYGLVPEELPSLRYDFVGLLGGERTRHPEPWMHLNDDNNRDHTKELCGLLPWSIAESFSRLKSCFSYLKTYEQGGGTPEEIANARQNIVYVMGVMGHYVGDAAQPLHTTKHYNGWVGKNPNSYTTNRSFHSWIDGGFWSHTGVPQVERLNDQLRTARPLVVDGATPAPDQVFPAVIRFVMAQHKQVEPLYLLHQNGNLTPGSETEELGKAFLQNQVIVGAQMLGDLWVTAWEQAPTDGYLKHKLAERRKTQNPAGP